MISFMIHFCLQADASLLTPPPPLAPPPSIRLGPRDSSCLLPGDGAAELGLTGGWWLLSAAQKIQLERLLAALSTREKPKTGPLPAALGAWGQHGWRSGTGCTHASLHQTEKLLFRIPYKRFNMLDRLFNFAIGRSLFSDSYLEYLSLLAPTSSLGKSDGFGHSANRKKGEKCLIFLL